MNLNTSIGLFNSSPGTIVDIIFEDNANVEEEHPKYILVEFKQYLGDEIDGRKIFPVAA
jgi:hypothetical protein